MRLVATVRRVEAVLNLTGLVVVSSRGGPKLRLDQRIAGAPDEPAYTNRQFPTMFGGADGSHRTESHALSPAGHTTHRRQQDIRPHRLP
jgi:hypothetical protein